MAIFHSYVFLPEGNYCKFTKNMAIVMGYVKLPEGSMTMPMTTVYILVQFPIKCLVKIYCIPSGRQM